MKGLIIHVRSTTTQRTRKNLQFLSRLKKISDKIWSNQPDSNQRPKDSIKKKTKRQKSNIEKQVIPLDGMISKINDLETEWKELRSANDDEWENNVALYEDCLREGDSLFDKGTKIYCERAPLFTKLNRVSRTIVEVKMKYEKTDHGPAATEG
ncbi:hypothetical protein LOAG_17303 [Loa loa]|uniref:Uncharacterized protein n=1 Tax=Loa loa TaxID=7209 RepID=A0A1S0UIS6_LOALO|nr:hypothetical protein LOAG_17303 [Loa loa]EJD75590.1 hypothetical protein LOAG_17303 [Loa loa]